MLTPELTERPESAESPRKYASSDVSDSLAAGTSPNDEGHESSEGHDQYFQYKSLCAWSLISVGLGLLSVLAFLDWPLLILPVLGVFMGVLGWRRIARRPQELTGLRAARVGIMLSALFLVAGGGYRTFVYVTEVPPGHERISYSNLKDVRGVQADLDGEKVFIKGYVYPTSKSTFNQFVLCRDNGDCCFGGSPKWSDMILVRLKEGEEMQFSRWQKKVAGTLRIKPVVQQQDGDVTMNIVYQLEEAFER